MSRASLLRELHSRSYRRNGKCTLAQSLFRVSFPTREKLGCERESEGRNMNEPQRGLNFVQVDWKFGSPEQDSGNFGRKLVHTWTKTWLIQSDFCYCWVNQVTGALYTSYRFNETSISNLIVRMLITGSTGSGKSFDLDSCTLWSTTGDLDMRNS